MHGYFLPYHTSSCERRDPLLNTREYRTLSLVSDDADVFFSPGRSLNHIIHLYRTEGLMMDFFKCVLFYIGDMVHD